jgi:hypothetical protein
MKRHAWLNQQEHLDSIQVPNHPKKIEAAIRFLPELESAKQVPRAASICPISPLA